MEPEKASRGPLTLLALILAVVFILLFPIHFSWEGWAPEFCRTSNCYCEPFHNGFFVLQPITAYSNLGFLAAGAFIFNYGAVRFRNSHPFGSFDQNLLGICCLLAGSFSFFSHASLTRVGEWLDLMGVYTLAGFFLFANLGSLLPAIRRGLAHLYGVTLVILGLQMAFAPQLQFLFVSGLTGGVILTEILGIATGRTEGNRRILLLVVLILAVGGFFWGPGGGSSGCLFNTHFPAHVVWHLSAAAAAVGLFLYLRQPIHPRH